MMISNFQEQLQDGDHGSIQTEIPQTRYTSMLFEADRDVPFYLTFWTAASQWMLLAGYVVVPGTFTSLQQSGTLAHTPGIVAETVQNPPLLVISCLFFFAGALSITWLAWTRRSNYVWLSGLFRLVRPIPLRYGKKADSDSPTIPNAVAGFFTALINVYTAQDGHWSVMAYVTATVTAGVAVVSSILTGYCLWVLIEVKSEHDRQITERRVSRLRP